MGMLNTVSLLVCAIGGIPSVGIGTFVFLTKTELATGFNQLLQLTSNLDELYTHSELVERTGINIDLKGRMLITSLITLNKLWAKLLPPANWNMLLHYAKFNSIASMGIVSRYMAAPAVYLKLEISYHLLRLYFPQLLTATDIPTKVAVLIFRIAPTVGGLLECMRSLTFAATFLLSTFQMYNAHFRYLKSELRISNTLSYAINSKLLSHHSKLSVIHTQLKTPVSALLSMLILFGHLSTLLLTWMACKTFNSFPWFMYMLTPVCSICCIIMFAIMFSEVVNVYENSHCIDKEWKLLARKNFWTKEVGENVIIMQRAWLRRKICAVNPLYFTLSGFIKPKDSTRTKQFQSIVGDLIDVMLLVPV
ncbi:unnamed protein product [Orchesella dallaii]|uniref:Odorant receptor n=1 Tax=Orchesella dallaii TaxID=48710 RepID=A0ABP1R6G0_9HEXA